MRLRPSYSLPIRADGTSVPLHMPAEPSLFPLRVSTRYPDEVTGGDVLFRCEADKGGTYYCKGDKDGRSIRATEWLLTHLARHLGIATPDCAILEDPYSGETLFGSRQVEAPASRFEVSAYLTTPQLNELGQPATWLASYLSQLYAVDLFVANPDRGLSNFLMQNEGVSRRLCAYDFASSNLGDLASSNFPVASSATVKLGRFLRGRHGFRVRDSIEMVDRIRAVPADTIEAFLGQMPDGWMSAEQRKGICDLWSARSFTERLQALCKGLTDESLL